MNNHQTVGVFLDDAQVGTVTLTRDGLCAFEYAPDFLASGFSISPLQLPLRSGVFVAPRTPFDSNFGVLDDCSIVRRKSAFG